MPRPHCIPLVEALELACLCTIREVRGRNLSNDHIVGAWKIPYVLITSCKISNMFGYSPSLFFKLALSVRSWRLNAPLNRTRSMVERSGVLL